MNATYNAEMAFGFPRSSAGHNNQDERHIVAVPAPDFRFSPALTISIAQVHQSAAGTIVLIGAY
jgi:hypothetical protein